jgi:hypothetical protein
MEIAHSPTPTHHIYVVLFLLVITLAIITLEVSSSAMEKKGNTSHQIFYLFIFILFIYFLFYLFILFLFFLFWDALLGQCKDTTQPGSHLMGLHREAVQLGHHLFGVQLRLC